MPAPASARTSSTTDDEVVYAGTAPAYDIAERDRARPFCSSSR